MQESKRAQMKVMKKWARGSSIIAFPIKKSKQTHSSNKALFDRIEKKISKYKSQIILMFIS